MPDFDDQPEKRPGSATPGTSLRDRRMERGLSLNDVAKRLHLTSDQVQALEQDQYERLPGAVFVRGFIRKYARLLDLDGEELVARLGWHGSAAEAGPSKRVIPNAEGPLMEHNWRTVLWTLMAVCVLIGIVILVYKQTETGLDTLALDIGGNDEIRANSPAASSPAGPVQLPANSSVPTARTGSPAMPLAVAPTFSFDETPAASATLQLELTDEVWVDVKDASNKTLFKKLAKAGEQAKVEGQPPFRVVLGNAAAAQVWYNGNAFAVPGGRQGQVVRFSVDDASLAQQKADAEAQAKKHR
ncbi:helix-turn-helix domain-containing protein [Thermithiobacillus plumbiphilus]|uniref:RodZ domain-containing protein n=1 Tax=Thermithiobacillus plumbiphilus TaxID=1729899 RepID=A0ABU9DAY8_9PROT